MRGRGWNHLPLRLRFPIVQWATLVGPVDVAGHHVSAPFAVMSLPGIQRPFACAAALGPGHFVCYWLGECGECASGLAGSG